ncbi:MAG: RagB/SusD family nutrient uptake outer membrane protein [Bacteroidetes bacterium]|nr:RagB/SusD family nutrient uptake outer membrane protein [Bacteroidota bacterium]
MNTRRNLVSLLTILLVLVSCSDLEEKYGGNLTSDQVGTSDTKPLYDNIHRALQGAFQNPFEVIALSEIPTDESMIPTRASNWDDNGVWRQLHLHKWTADHQSVVGAFVDLSGVVFAATDYLRYQNPPVLMASARFYRALAMYWLMDLFDQVPYRDPGESTLLEARVRKWPDNLNYIIDEVNAVMPTLPDSGPASAPTKYAAKMLLMKCYLNKAVYANRQSPQFDTGDMNKVIALADDIINSNQYSFSSNYFDNFATDNDTRGRENIFTEENVGGVFVNSLLIWYVHFPLHYNSSGGGFNGWTTLSDFYDKFKEGDMRRGQAYIASGGPPNPGKRINMGFLVGQQYDLDTDALLVDTDGITPLVFTPEVKIIETGATLNITGIRPQKYAVDYPNLSSFTVDNDWVYFRFPDVLLMKAEAILRGGTATSAGAYGSSVLELVNSIRTHPSRGAGTLTSVDLNVLLDERGRELWLECWRRQDLIRFGKFLQAFQEKDYTSDTKYLVFPIPNQQLFVNKNLVQNTGYN